MKHHPSNYEKNKVYGDMVWVLVIIISLCSLASTCNGQSTWEQPMSQSYPLGFKTETRIKGDTTFINHWRATEVYTTMPPQYGRWVIDQADTIISKPMTPKELLNKIYGDSTIVIDAGRNKNYKP